MPPLRFVSSSPLVVRRKALQQQNPLTCLWIYTFLSLKKSTGKTHNGRFWRPTSHIANTNNKSWFTSLSNAPDPSLSGSQGRAFTVWFGWTFFIIISYIVNRLNRLGSITCEEVGVKILLVLLTGGFLKQPRPYFHYFLNLKGPLFGN